MGTEHNVFGGKNNRWGNKNKKGASNKSASYEPTKLFNTLVKGILIVVLVGGTINTIFPFMGNKAPINNEKIETTNQISKTSTVNKHTEKGLDINNDIFDNILESMNESVGNTISDAVFIDASKINSDKDYRKNVMEKLSKYGTSTLYILINKKQLTKEETENKISKLEKMVSDSINNLGEYNYSGVTKGVFKNETQSGDITSFYIALLYS